jgi:hypothetical protein
MAIGVTMSIEKNKTDNLFDFQLALLDKEIEYLHTQIAHFDTLSFQIKGWAITIWAAIIAFGSSQTKAIVILASIPAMFTFWVIDSFFKKYQYRHTYRLGVIEMFLDSRGEFLKTGIRRAFSRRDFGLFPIHDPISRRTRKLRPQFEAHFTKNTRFLRAMFVPNVAFFYLLLILTSVVVAAFVA